MQALRNSCVENPGGLSDYAEHFFAREYRMNYLLHTYTKPLICWGHGVVMGGGLDLGGLPVSRGQRAHTHWYARDHHCAVS